MKSVNDLAYLVWEKGKDVPGRDRSVWRFDDCGALIRLYDYGKQSEYGWDIDQKNQKEMVTAMKCLTFSLYNGKITDLRAMVKKFLMSLPAMAGM